MFVGGPSFGTGVEGELARHLRDHSYRHLWEYGEALGPDVSMAFGWSLATDHQPLPNVR